MTVALVITNAVKTKTDFLSLVRASWLGAAIRCFRCGERNDAHAKEAVARFSNAIQLTRIAPSRVPPHLVVVAQVLQDVATCAASFVIFLVFFHSPQFLCRCGDLKAKIPES